MPMDAPSPAATLAPPSPCAAAVSQARLNEIAAEIIRTAPGDRALIAMAVEALRRHNGASGFLFEGAATDLLDEDAAGLVVSATRLLESRKRADASRARWESKKLELALSPDAAALTRQLKDDAPALVYVIAHAALGAAKIGVNDPLGSRIAEHRRAGWQLLAAFRVAADAACAIEADVLRWWRGRSRLAAVPQT